MADLRYSVKVDTTQAQRDLKDLQDRIAGISDTFNNLKSVIAGISLGALIQEATSFASEIKKVAAATNLGIDSVLGFTRAVQQNGGTLDNAQDIVYEFVNALGEAAAGASDSQKAFRDAGVSISDLGKLSEQALFDKVIKGLGDIGDLSKRAAVANKIFGESWQGINLKGLSGDYDSSRASSIAYVDSIRSAAAAQAQLKTMLFDFQIALLKVLKPITDLSRTLDIGVEKMQKFLQAVIAIAAAFGLWKVFGGAIALVRALWSTITGLATAISGASAIVVNFFKNFGLILENVKSASSLFSGLRAVVTAVANTIAEVFAPAMAAIKVVSGPILLAIAGYWGYIQESTESAIQKLKEYADALTFGVFELSGDATPKPEPIDNTDAETRRKILSATALELGKISTEYRQQSTDLYLSLFNSNQRMDAETRILKLSEDQREIVRAQLDVDDQRIAKVQDLRNQIEQLQTQMRLGDEDPTLSGRIQLLQQQIPIIEKIYKQHSANLPEYIRNLQIAKNIEDQRLKGLEAERGLRDILRGLSDQTQDVQLNMDFGLTPLQKQIQQIKLESYRSARGSRDAFVSSFGEAGKITDENFLKMVEGLDAISTGADAVAQKQIQQLMVSREWASGWSVAFAEYVDEATNAAKMAERVFAKATQGMEDAIVDFAKTGKFEWKGFVASMAEELLRSQIRQLFAQMFGGSGSSNNSGSSILGTIASVGKLMGFANGGIIPTNGPVIVGERGPEILTGAAGRNVIPNNQLGGSSIINYNISAVDAISFKQMIARDPGFIHAVATQGARAYPQTRR